jgi:DNA primase
MALLDLLNQDGISVKRISGTNGGEYAGPCPLCGGTDRFRLWPEQGDGGKWWCRQCGKGGDAIQYLREHRGLGYREACLLLGQEPKSRKSFDWKPNRATWQPREITEPPGSWQVRAEVFVVQSERTLWSVAGSDALAWLHGRGLVDGMIQAHRLGWNAEPLWLNRQAWGLPQVLKDNGRPKKLWLPAGLVIPKITGEAADVIQRVRIRQPEGEPRYYLVPGSETGPLVIPGEAGACVVVESELDAVLLSQEAGSLCTVIALGNAQARPDQATTELLQAAGVVLVALDSDQAGAKEAWTWWLQHFPNAERWPVIHGKDPSEARQNGLDLLSWLTAGLQGSARSKQRAVEGIST